MARPWVCNDSPLWLMRAATYAVATLVWLFGGDTQSVRITLISRCRASEECAAEKSLATLP